MVSTQPRLDGKVALVTGASRGIGRAIAQRLASAGATVVVSARSASSPAKLSRLGAATTLPGTLDETVALIQQNGGHALAVPADLEDKASRDSLIGRVHDAAGHLDIVVNNAGFADYALVEDLPEASFERTIDHYLRASFTLSKDAIPFMKEAGAGWIVNIGSVTAFPPMRPYQDYAKTGGDVLYAAVKAALHRFTQGLAAELVDANIAVNVVGPSTAIRTPGAAELIPDDFPCEDVAYLAATVLDMCHLPASERTGEIAFSMHWPHRHQLEVRSLDGLHVLPPAQIPPWSHPALSDMS